MVAMVGRWHRAGTALVPRPGCDDPEDGREGTGRRRGTGRTRMDRPSRSSLTGPTDGSGTERGSGTMLMIGVMIVITVLALTGTFVAAYAVAVHRARAAADLAALSGAVAWSGGADACAAARTIAQANGTTLESCDRVGDRLDFVITVRVDRQVPPMMPGLPGEVSARAHAGPVSPPR